MIFRVTSSSPSLVVSAAIGVASAFIGVSKALRLDIPTTHD
jgi:hypothetical protein